MILNHKYVELNSKKKIIIILIKKDMEFLKKYWMVIVNYLVIIAAYSTIFDKGMVWTELILGLWIFVSAAFGMYKLFIKRK